MYRSTDTEVSKANYKDMVEQVRLITEREIEVKFVNPPVNPMEKIKYKVYIDGSEIYDFMVLSFFNNTVTLRLKKSVKPTSNQVEIKILPEKCEFPQDILYKASYIPYYSFLDMGRKSKIEVRGSANVPPEIIKQASESINKMFGRTGYLSFLMSEKGCRLSVVGSDESVYNAPEYRELYNESDAMERVTIPGTVEKPVIVTTSKDIMREGNTNEYAMIRDLSRLFYQISISDTAAEASKGHIEDPVLPNIPVRLKEAYESARESSLWSYDFMKTEEEYYVRGTMIFFELVPESEDGSWENGIGPVNTRLELREYDKKLFDVLAEIYGEFEYLSPYEDSKIMPWFVGTQPNRFGIDGNPLPKAEISEVNLITPYHIEVKFNRQVFNAEDKDKYRVVFTRKNGEAEEISDFKILPYAWDTVTLQFGNWELDGEKAECLLAPEFVKGKICTDITGDALKKGEYANGNHAELNGNIKLIVIGDDIVDWNGSSLGTKEYDVALKPYFSKIKRTAAAGIYIYASNRVKTETIELCSRYIDEMLSNKTYGQKIADGITYNGGGLSIIADGEHAYMQPHLRAYYSNFGLYVEGFGGGVAQTTETNVLRNRSKTRYKDEFILGHEFGHTIEMTGIRFGLPELYKKVGRTYEKVTKAGLWANSYAGSNRNEYFATLANIWFSTMSESVDGTWDGTRGPVNTREELYRYDMDGYNLMKKIYYNGDEIDDLIIVHQKNFVGTAWESYSVPNKYDIDGSLL